jgi:hypothetical protein
MNREGNISLTKRGQQEIVGFVLIVVLVVIGLMVFLLVSIRETPVEENSVAVGNLLESIMKHTTSCAPSFVPDYDDYEALFKSCYQDKTCSNLNEPSCDYLDRELQAFLETLIKTEATVSAYQLDFVVKEDDGEEGLMRILEGECGGVITSAQKTIISGSENLVIRLSLCKNI